MSFSSQFRASATQFIGLYGTPFTYGYYPRTFSGADYDDAYGRTTQSGTSLSGACLWQSIDTSIAGADLKFLEAGLIKHDDHKMYVAGSIVINQDSVFVLNGGSYASLPDGYIEPSLSSTTLYHKIYVRTYTPTHI